MPHIHEKIDFCADALIVHENKILLIFHKKHKIWLQIGGHIELDEDPQAALLREIKEECGLDVEIVGKKEPDITVEGTKFLYPPAFMNIHKINDTHKHIGLFYICKAESDAFVHNKEEHDDIRWFSKEDLDNPEFKLSESLKFYAKEALDRVK